ncbi:hypothetical protein AB0L00_23555 [Actinoallomurus sp. NPDC052308]|uniref:hypothetical protein n=1 Tax=Actinoallomurus sp. NPDC052308 TaxID=3155530 RepID=UPI003449EA86
MLAQAAADLTSTPWRPALAIADSSGGIVARTTAHGEATIMKVISRSSDHRIGRIAFDLDAQGTGAVQSSGCAGVDLGRTAQ